jgi:RNA polymerase sigma-70 factor (ECF subfamily)
MERNLDLGDCSYQLARRLIVGAVALDLISVMVSSATEHHSDSIHAGPPAVVVLAPDQLTLGLLRGPSFFGSMISEETLPHFFRITSEIQQAHPETNANLLFVRFGTRAAIYPYWENIEPHSIRKIGDVPDIRNIGQPTAFRTAEVAGDLSAYLITHLNNGRMMEAHAASGKAFDNAGVNTLLTLADVEGVSRQVDSLKLEPELIERISAVRQEVHQIALGIPDKDGHFYAIPPTTLADDTFKGLIELDPSKWEGRGQFLGAAATAVQQVLLDHALRVQPVELVKNEVFSAHLLQDILTLNEAVNRLREFSPDDARVFELRFYGGLTIDEVADTLGLSRTTVKDKWGFTKAWFRRELGL